MAIIAEIGFAILVLGCWSYVFGRQVLPILFEPYDELNSRLVARQDRGWKTNWLLVLGCLAIVLLVPLSVITYVAGALLIASICSGAWLAMAMGHPDAP